MAFKKQGKTNKLENKIKVITENVTKIVASQEEKITCPHCKKVIGTKIGNIYQILDKRLVSLTGQICPNCKKEI